MLRITIHHDEYWDEKKEVFVYPKETTLQLEHSLVSISKWESKWNKAFLSTKNKTAEETIDYIKFMTLTQNVDPEVYNRLTNEHLDKIYEYINAPMTATYFSENNTKTASREVITAEIIYYWMIAFNIPFECQKWHLNRLLTLIRVCDIKNRPPKKMSRQELLRRNAAINAARKKKWNTTG